MHVIRTDEFKEIKSLWNSFDLKGKKYKSRGFASLGGKTIKEMINVGYSYDILIGGV